MKTLFEKLIIICLAVAGPSVQNCLAALPPGNWGVPKHSSSATYDISGGDITVESVVYSESATSYLYLYQIRNISSSLGLSFFSVPILPGATASLANYNTQGGTVLPSDTPDSSINTIVVQSIENCVFFTTIVVMLHPACFARTHVMLFL